MKKLRVIFMGTPDFSVPVLDYLIKNTNVVLVVTQPDKQIGRDKKILFSPIKKKAIENEIEIFQPIKIKNDYEIIKAKKPDLIITCAFGQILPEVVLNIPRLGSINVHASLLPKYRGAAPIQWAILDGEKVTGVTLMYMDKGMDTGDIIASKKVDISDDDNVGTLHDKLSLLGPELLDEQLPKIINGTNDRIKQDDALASYTKMIKREDEKLDFSMPGDKIINKVRALSPWPVAYFLLNETEIKVIKATFMPQMVNKVGRVIYDKNNMYITCADGLISIERLKPFGKKEMDIKAYLNGIKKEDNRYIE